MPYPILRDMLQIEPTEICVHRLLQEFTIELPPSDQLLKELKQVEKVKEWEPSIVRYLEKNKVKVFEENQLLDLADTYMDRNQVQPASILYQINTMQYPNSVTSWERLAGLHLRLGKVFAAIEYLGEVLNLEPENQYARRTMRHVTHDCDVIV